MVNTQKESALKKLFAAFGRKPFKEQINVYMEWAEKYASDTVINVIERVVNNEDHLPSVAKLIKEEKILLPMKNELSTPNDFNCCYCGGTGYLPYLYEPNDIISVWFIRMMGCRCPVGQPISVPKYFDEYKKLQFEDEAKQHPFMNHYQMVTYIMNQRNKEMKRDSNNGMKTESAVKKEKI